MQQSCLPLDILFSKQPMQSVCNNQQSICPCCRRLPITKIRVLPLSMSILEEAGRLRDKDNEILSINNNGVSYLACRAQANSIALSNGTSKRAFAADHSISRSYQTGRWAAEESSYTDKLVSISHWAVLKKLWTLTATQILLALYALSFEQIKSFDAGLLPLPHGIKLNDFLCDLLSCRTSRLTKKLKNAKLSARCYRSWASGHTTGAFQSYNNVGGDIQRAQTLFCKTITPEWVRMELQFNISRMWRTHLANFW